MSIKFRRGFKTEAEKYAREYRAELQLSGIAPLDMFQLAEHLCVPTYALSTLKTWLQNETYTLVTETKKKIISAITLYAENSRCFVVYNDSNAKTRQQSDLAHELSHIILGHAPSDMNNVSDGTAHYDKTLEAEANCLAGILLVPNDAAFMIEKKKIPIARAALIYQISEQMMQKRINETGVKKILSRSKARWLS